jgi:hypothetical protein
MEHKLILLCYALFAVSTVYAQAAAFSSQEQSDLLLWHNTYRRDVQQVAALAWDAYFCS